MARTFVHLHNHTHYSLLDGANRIDEMLEAAKDDGMPAVAMTDHGNLFGAVEFYEEAKALGLKPILGIEAYVNPGPLKDAPSGKREKNYSHLILLARNDRGWRNLIELSSRAYLEGFYYKPRIDREMLAAHSDGLIALSGCLSGEVNTLLLEGRFEEARAAARFHQEIFDGHYYLELQDHQLPEDRILLPRAVDLARELGLPLVATNDAHYLTHGHADAHDALLCIQTGKTKDDPDRLRFGSHEMYFKSSEQMYELFRGMESAVENSVKIAEACDVSLEFGKLKLPHFPKPEEFETLEAYLDQLCADGLRKRYPSPSDALWERLRFELQVIHQMGYAGYFLIVQDFIRFARSRGVPVGPGRGSAAGSLVSYCLGITNIDPIRYQLLFERFLNPERISMPDIDVDFSDRGRAEVIQYVVRKYGAKNVCQIITFGTMAARAAVRDVGRVMGLPYADVDRIAKLVPAELGITLEKALEKSPELAERYQAEPKVQEIVDTARNLEGLARHASTHAAGVVITPTPLTDYVPLYKSNEDEITTQFDMSACEKIGLLKMDFLGLRTLTVLQDCLAHLRLRGIHVDLDELAVDDVATFQLLARGETVGIFQFESTGITDYMRKLKPESLEDMIAMNALYRPGPMGMIEDFIQRKHGLKQIRYEHPMLEPILRETYGVIVYQEQVMQIAQAMAGYSLGEADLLRRAMGKKKKEIMVEQRAIFVTRAVERRVPERDAERIFDLMAHFAGYGFNKSHSAGYALVAYQTAWLKAHHPVEFLAASLTSEMSDSDRIMVLLAECKRMGVAVLPPDVNCSDEGFTVDAGRIRFGLGAVKGIGHNAIASIRAARAEGESYRDLHDLCARIDPGAVNKKCLEALILSGALDGFREPRARLAEGLSQAMDWASRRRRELESGQGSLFFAAAGAAAKPTDTIRPSLPEVAEWSVAERLSREKSALGFYVSGHPLDSWRRCLDKLACHATHELDGRDDGSGTSLGGLVLLRKLSTDKQGRPICFFTVEDFTGTVECLVFSEPFQECRAAILGEQPVLVRGKLSTRDNEKPKILVESVIALSDLVDRGRLALHVSLSTAIEDERLLAIRAWLERYPGDCPVYLHVDSRKLGGVIVRLRGLKVRLDDELLRILEEEGGIQPMKVAFAEARGFRSVDIFGDPRLRARNQAAAQEPRDAELVAPAAE